MDLRYVTATGTKDADLADLDVLLARDDGFVWLDVTDWTPDDAQFVAARFGFHPVALGICGSRNPMPMVHGYPDHIFMVLHRPVVIGQGRVTLVELDTFLGERFLVTIHPSEEAATGMVSEIDETLDRLAGDRIRPAKPVDLLHAIVSLIALRQRLVVQDVARRVSDVEAQVLGRAMSDPQASLEEMFMVRYELLSVRTAAAHSEDVMARARRLEAVTSKSSDHSLGDLQDMFRRVHRMTDSEQELLNGVIDLYRTSTDTKMMIATERLAVLAAVTLPVTAIASVYGMNVIVYPHSQIIQLIVVLAVMAVISLWLLRWARRQGWW